MKAWLVVLLAACGDQLAHVPVDDATSGTRLKLEWTFYGDGSRQVSTEGFYDVALHQRCIATPWADASVRCAPLADEALFTDDRCENLVGRADSIDKPLSFIGYDTKDGVRLPARIYHAGGATDPITQYYELVDGECTGPRSTPGDVPYFEISGASDVVELFTRELGGDADRLGVVVTESDDGVHLPRGFYDRELGAYCRAETHGGVTICEPPALLSSVYLDPECEQPGVAALITSTPPDLVRRQDATGCGTIHRRGPAASNVLYQRVDDVCARLAPNPLLQAYAIGPEVELAPLARTVEDDPDHRLQRIALTSGDLRMFDERMFDTATRAECRREVYDTVTRCIPATVQVAVVGYAEGCGLEVLFTELPARSCAPVTFAVRPDAEGILQVHAIGERVADPLYQPNGATCVERQTPPGMLTRAVGPAIPLETFVGGHEAGAR